MSDTNRANGDGIETVGDVTVVATVVRASSTKVVEIVPRVASKSKLQDVPVAKKERPAWLWSAIDVDEENSKTLKLSIDGWLSMNKVPNDRADIDDEDLAGNTHKVAETRNGMIVVGVDRDASVHFVANWSEVWTADKADYHDDFGAVAPLFRDCVEFYGHRGALIALAVMVVYFIIVKLVVVGIDPENSGSDSLSITAFVLMYILYLFGLMVYKGSLYEKKLMRTKKQIDEENNAYLKRSEEAQKDTAERVMKANSVYLHQDNELQDVEDPTLFQLFKTMVKRIIKEAYESSCCVHTFNSMSTLKTPLKKVGCCSKVAQVLPEHRDTKEDILAREMNPAGKRPNFYVLLNMGVKCINKCGVDPYLPPEGFRPFLMTALSLIPLLFAVIYATRWYQLVVVMGCLDPVYGPYHETTKLTCDARVVEVCMSLGYFTHWLVSATLVNGCILIMFGLIYGADIAHSLAKTWFERFLTLRRIRGTDSDLEEQGGSGELEENAQDVQRRRIEFTALTRLLHIMPYVRRDAYERYIYIHELMLAFGKRWRSLLTGLLVLTGAQIVYGFYLLFSTAIDGYLAASMAGAIILFIFPVYCLAYTNSAVETIVNGFAYAAPEDYEALGGRDTWLAFVGQAPLYWYVFGFAVTRTWLTGIAGGIILAAIATVGNTYLTSGAESASSTTTGTSA